MAVNQAETSAPRDGIELGNAHWKVMDKGDDGTSYGWKVEVRSTRKDACEVHLAVRYLDADGFEVEHDTAIVHAPPGTNTAVTGRSLELGLPISQVRIELNYCHGK